MHFCSGSPLLHARYKFAKLGGHMLKILWNAEKITPTLMVQSEMTDNRLISTGIIHGDLLPQYDTESYYRFRSLIDGSLLGSNHLKSNWRCRRTRIKKSETWSELVGRGSGYPDVSQLHGLTQIINSVGFLSLIHHHFEPPMRWECKG